MVVDGKLITGQNPQVSIYVFKACGHLYSGVQMFS